jgi:CheY-like chemotaxis protein
MDGLAAVKKIKEDKRLSSIPVVALTSFAMQGDEEKALSAGCVGYITKPFHTNEFTPKIARYIGA